MAYARRIVLTALAFGLVAFSVELAHHSVHHLGHEENAPSCVLASAATHTSVDLAHPPEVAVARAPARLESPRPRTVPPHVAFPRRDSPRAPPLPT